jgi:hypothetical protein
MFKVLVEPAHDAIELHLARVGERGVPDIVGQCQSLGQMFIQAECRGDGSRDLGNLDGVRQAVAEVIGEPGREDLSLILQAAEGARVDHAIAVSLKLVPVRVGKLGITPSSRPFHRETQVSERARDHYCGS